jgi:chitin synthase
MTYGAAMILFGLCNVVALWCAGYTVYAAAPKSVAAWKEFGHLLFTNPAFRDIVISLAATYGLYVFSSILHAEPFHLITSFLCVFCLFSRLILSHKIPPDVCPAEQCIRCLR